MKNTNVLVVIDMQNDFLTGALRNEEGISIIPNVVEKINNFKGLVIATRDTHYNNYLETHEGKYLPVVHCVEDTDGWKIESSVQEAIDNSGASMIVNKNQFGTTDLYAKIRDVWQYNGNLNITLIGVCTDICVVSNALILRAKFPEANITVDASCCAGVTPETHRAALTTMKMCHIDIENGYDNEETISDGSNE